METTKPATLVKLTLTSIGDDNEFHHEATDKSLDSAARQLLMELESTYGQVPHDFYAALAELALGANEHIRSDFSTPEDNFKLTREDVPPAETDPSKRVPQKTPLTGVEHNGFRVVTASDMGMVRSSVTTARCTGSVGDRVFVYASAAVDVPIEQREIERWAIVERI